VSAEAKPTLEQDRLYLEACFALARLGEGETSPNPMVGALIVKDGQMLGQGYHRRAGERHAEVAALEEAGEAARGSTLYVNLEPCAHYGRTSPCVDAIIKAGVSEVVACMRDPDPRVNGRGFRRLKESGIEVRQGTLRKKALRFNESFVKFVTTGIPYVTLKAAITVDGRIAARGGESKWITSDLAREQAQQIRFQNDGILVGIRTLLKDDPQLTARCGSGKPLTRVILDSALRTPPSARALQNGDGGRTLIFTLASAPARARNRLDQIQGVEVINVEGTRGKLNWHPMLFELGKRGITRLLVEGGGKVLGSALAAGVADRVTLFLAPRILGEEGVAAFSGLAVRGLSEAKAIHEWTWRAVGSELLIEGYLRSPQE
jgi:diaminohydroxyphosphoribosylaminopyrimidine deaminase/5-amino-6-(5-phosphoribosylamino)uracil reductase